MERKNEGNSTDEIEITSAMIRAAAEVLWKHPLLDVPEGWAEELAAAVLRRGLAKSGQTHKA